MRSNLKFFLLFCIATLSLNAEVLLFSKAYQLALKNAHDLKSSIYEVQGTQERVVQEKSQLYPQLNLSGYYKKSRYKYSNEYANNPGGLIEQNLLNIGITLKQSIYNAEIYSRIDIAASKKELYEIGVDLEKEQLAQTVFLAYLDVLKSNNRINLDKSYLKYAKSRLDELTKKYKMFMANKMDLLEMRVEYKSAQIDLIKDKKISKVNKLKLQQLIGDAEYEFPTIDSDANILSSMETMKESVLNKEDFSNNLSLLQATLELKVSKKEIDNAYDGHYPKLDLEGSAYAFKNKNPDFLAPYQDQESIMLVFNLPIYSGGVTSSRVVENTLKSKSINEKLLDTKLKIKVAYDEYIANFEASVDSVSMYKEAHDSALLYVNSIEQGYAHGLKSIIDVNDAKNKEYEVKYKYIENIYEMVDSYISLLILTNNFDSINLLDKIVE